MQFQIFLTFDTQLVRDQASELIKQGYVIIKWFEIKEGVKSSQQNFL